MINFNNLSDVDTIGLHILPTALKYGTPVFNADDRKSPRMRTF